MKTRTLKVDIPITDSTRTIGGYLDLPMHNPHGYVLLAHCFTCSSSMSTIARLSKILARAGFGSLRIDFQGLGRSSGAFEDSSLSSNIEDLLSAARWLAEHYESPIAILGHSFGGVATIYTAKALLDSSSSSPSSQPALPVRLVATVGTPFDPRLSSIVQPHAVDAVARGEQDLVPIPGRPFSLSHDFLVDLARYTPETTAAAISSFPDATIALRTYHSPLDLTVPFREARKFGSNHTLVSIPQADHLLTWPGAVQFVGEDIARALYLLS